MANMYIPKKLKDVTFDEQHWKLVPIKPSKEMMAKALKIDYGADVSEESIVLNLWNVLLSTAPCIENVGDLDDAESKLNNLVSPEQRRKMDLEALSKQLGV